MKDALYCVEINLPSDRVDAEDLVEGILWDYAAGGLQRQDPSTFSELVEEPRPRAEGSIRWRLYLEEPLADEDLRSLKASLDGTADVFTWTLTDLSFLTAWKEHFKPSKVSPRVWVYPPWDRPDTGDAIGVEIEPGMAFGTGTHSTTRLCLAALDRLIGETAPSLIDIGCGSAVLSIAAAKLGANVLCAVDNDPDAVRIANENLVLNHLTQVASTTDVADIQASADLVVANILPHILIVMGEALVRITAPAGVLLLSGIVTEQRERLEAHFDSLGMKCERSDNEGDWWSLEFRHSA
ncbi:MAG: ribosomal protein L11 methyltransferase [Bradymonadia bacterium]|jgi:ribosomal protein L11 methyltransferase